MSRSAWQQQQRLAQQCHWLTLPTKLSQSHSSHSPIMDAKLKSLKVADLKTILTNAAVSFPAKATKGDLITRIQASQEARDAYAAIYDATPAQEE